MSSDGTFSAAEVIYQDHLDVLTRALMTQDVDLFASRMSLPHHVRTQNEEFWIEDLTQLQTGFAQVCGCMASSGVTEMIRLVKSAEFEGDTVITGMHETHQFHNAAYIMPPYANRIRLEKQSDDVWRETHSANAVELRGRKFGLPQHNPDNTEVPALGTDAKRTMK